MNRLHPLWVFLLLSILIAPMAQAGYQIRVTVSQAAAGATSSITGFQCYNYALLGIDGNGQLHVQSSYSSYSGLNINKPTGQFTAAACIGGFFYALDSNGQLWRWDKNTPAAVYDTGVKALYSLFYVRNDGSAFLSYDKKPVILPAGETIRLDNGLGGVIITNSNKFYQLSRIDTNHYGFTLIASNVVDGVVYQWGSRAYRHYLWLKTDGTLGGDIIDPSFSSACTGASHITMGYDIDGNLMCFFSDGTVKSIGSLYWQNTTIQSTTVPPGSKVIKNKTWLSWPTVRTPDNRILVVYPYYTTEIFNFSGP